MGKYPLIKNSRVDNVPSGGSSQKENSRRSHMGDDYHTLSNFQRAKPKLRGELHRAGAFLYPPIFGIPLFFRAAPAYKVSTLIFSLAVEGIMAISAILHTVSWRNEGPFQNARKADFSMIFIGIALFYSSLGKILMGGAQMFSSVIEPLVWICAAVGVTFKCLIPNGPNWLNTVAFLTQGWAVLPVLPFMFRTASVLETTGLLMGAVFTTGGAIALMCRWPNNWRYKSIFGPHEMFHAGTVLMFVSFWFTMWLRVGVNPL